MKAVVVGRAMADYAKAGQHPAFAHTVLPCLLCSRNAALSMEATRKHDKGAKVLCQRCAESLRKMPPRNQEIVLQVAEEARKGLEKIRAGHAEMELAKRAGGGIQ